MSELRVASRYAKSLVDLAVEKNMLEEVKKDMDFFSKVADENPQFAAMLKNPIINHSKKQAVLKALFTGKVGTLTLSFFEIITRKNRESYLVSIAKQVHAQYNALKGIDNAVVTTAMPLTDELRAKFKAMITQKTGRLVEMKEVVNPDIIGGYILKIGDRQIDDSVKSRLNNLRMKFSDNPYIVKY